MTSDKKKKIIIIVVLVLVMIVLGMSLNSCSNSIEEDKAVQKKTINKKTKSQATTKADEKKDESKVKQEETTKSDSSNKSNTSESKKDNTASTSSSSNKNNTSSSKPSNSGNNSSSSKPSNNNDSSSNNSKPAEHKHDWVAQYKTVNVPEKGRNEQVLVQAAYDEQVPIKEMQEFTFCSTCGANITGHAVEHLENSLNCQGYYTEWREVTTGYNTFHHEAVYETRYVVDSPATTKQELTGYKCSGCGKTRSN